MSLRNLLLPCLAVLALTSMPEVEAKDRPFPKAPTGTEGMTTCPEQGEGFFKMPGSDTCIKIGGRVRGETGVRSGSGRRSDAIDWRTEGSLNMDARNSSSDSRFVIRMRGIRGSN